MRGDMERERIPQHGFAARESERKKNNHEPHVLNGRIGEKPLVVRLAHHENGAYGERENTEGKHRRVAERRGRERHHFANADDREERAIQ